MSESFQDWDKHEEWTRAAIASYRAISGPLRARAAIPETIDAALFDCLATGRPFCFMRTLDTVDRVRLRDAFEHKAWAADALARYRQVAQMVTRSDEK
jgi:hypothetical protein